MVNQHDPDPLAPDEYRAAYLDGWHDGYADGPRAAASGSGLRLAFYTGLGLGAVIAGLAVLLLTARAYAAPRGAHVIPSGAAVPAGETVESDHGFRGAPPDWATTGSPGSPRVESSEAAPRAVSGIASWYPARGFIAAAGPGLRHGDWRGRLVVVSALGRSVTVTLSDWCACPRRLIDLSDDAFARLVPLSLGLVYVSVSSAGPVPTPPATDR